MSYLLTWSVCYWFSEELLFLVAKPFLLVTSLHFISTQLTESFNTYLSSSCLCALFFCSPYCVYQMWCFLIPSTFQSHRQYYSHYCQISFLSFLLCVWLSHGILLPTLWHFLSNYNTTSTTVFVIQLQPRIYDFILLTYRFFFLAALCSQIPIFILYFIQAQVIQLKQCIQHRKLVWFVCVLLGAFLTPPECQFITTFSLGIIIETTFVFAYIQCEYQKA